MNVNMAGGSPEKDEQQEEAATKRTDYSAPKLTVVGTVDQLTLAVNNDGTGDGIANTGGGG
jgi:hypothetical protein